MDKNMINIDDLFKQRLGNGEEEDRAGAWLQMRDLLDEKMPIGAINWRRIFMMGGGLLLLAAATWGGYEFTSSSRNLSDAGINVSVSNTEKPSAITKNTNDVLQGNNTPLQTNATSSNDNAAPVKKVATNNNQNNTINSNNQSDTKDANKNSNSDNNNNASSVALVTSANNNVNQPVKNTDKSNSNSDIANGDVTATAHKQTHKKNNTGINTTASLTTKLVPNSAHTTISKDPVTDKVVAVNDNNSTKDGLKKTHKAHKIGSNGTSVSNIITPTAVNSKVAADNTVAGNSGSGQQKNTGAPILKDSIEKLMVREYFAIDPGSRILVLHVDTVSTGMMPRFITPASDVVAVADNSDKKKKHHHGRSSSSIDNIASNSNTEVKTEINPAAKQNTTTNMLADKTASNMSNKLNSARHAKKGWDFSAVTKAMHDFEYNIGKTKFYPGLIAGVNSTFGGVTNSGFHFGFTGEFALTPQMSIMAEFKYTQRITNGVLNNDYTQNRLLDSVGSPASLYVIEKDQIQHYYNYSTLNNLEMPIVFRYRLANFYLYAGGNLIYNFTVNTEEIDHKILGVPETKSYPSSYNWQAIPNKISVSDFNSRFGLGYIFGASYEFSPSLMVDANLNHTFWDNAKTGGAKQVSEILYRGYSAQLSIIYRLNRKKPDVVIPRY